MAPDYDLSSLQPWQADLWIRLQVHVVLAQILAEQGKRPASTRWAGPHPSPLHCEAAEDTTYDRLRVRPPRLRGTGNLEAPDG